jgi:methyl-accepting chemotaxis protein
LAHYDAESGDEHYRSSPHIALGNLTDTIQIDRLDELGKLNEILIAMQAYSKAMMDQIAEAAKLAEDNADALSFGMEETHEAADLQSGAVSRIAATVEQLMTSVHEMEDTASSLLELITYSQFTCWERS